MSYVRVWIHAVWGTRSRIPSLTREVREQLFAHIRENARGKEIHLAAVNGYTEHVHCLFGLNADTSVAKAVQLIKGESAHWINQERLMSGTFQWANEYYAISVSEEDVASVRRYIEAQEEHHRTRPFSEEVAEFLQEHGIDRQG